MKVNGAAYTEGTKAWVTLNAKSSLECDMSTPTPATDAIQSLAWTKSLSTNTGVSVISLFSHFYQIIEGKNNMEKNNNVEEKIVFFF